MKQVRMPGLARPVSPLALGMAGFADQDQADAVLDGFLEAGGDIVDTAFHYGQGKADSLLGGWLRRRGTRDAVSIIAKGAHTPTCFPDAIHQQLDASLENLGTDHAEVYMMHRDNTDVPVSEFIDAMLAEHHAGRIGSYGFSNWTIPRIEEAMAYALDRGAPPPTALSYNYSLADMVDAVWPGVMAANGPRWRALVERADLGLYSWSSQARGFFTDRGDPDGDPDPELVRCWFSEENLARRSRAADMADERGLSLNSLALAWALHQPFALVSLIGPLTTAELADSLSAADIELSAEDVAWLATGERSPQSDGETGS